MIVVIALFVTLVLVALGTVRSRSARARAHAQLISDVAATPPRLADTNVVSLDAHRVRRLTSSRAASCAANAKQSQIATR